MEDKHATIKDDVIPDLLVSPHIVNELFNLLWVSGSLILLNRNKWLNISGM